MRSAVPVPSRASRRRITGALTAGLLLATGLSAGASPATAATAAAVADTSIGVNLAPVRDWTTEWPFVDVFRTSRFWISQQQGAAWGAGPALNLDERGWVRSLQPGQYVDAAVLTEGARAPRGRYVVTWEGDGDVTLFGSATPVARTANRFEFDAPTATLFLRITRTNPHDHVRNIHVWLPGFEQTGAEQVYHPLFLQRLQGMGNLRFKDWMNVDSSQNVEVSSFDRYTRPDSATQTRGVAPELMTGLANRVGADPWFSMPHTVSDEWVRSFATAVRAGLAPDRKIYVEYSNELWNNIYQQTRYVRERGVALGLSTDANLAGLRYQAQRSVEIFRIWQEVFGAEADSRLVRVLATQSANPWAGEQVASWQQAYRNADAIAVAPYFECSGAWVPGDPNPHPAGSTTAAPYVKAAGVDGLLNMCQQQIDTTMRSDISAYRSIADRHGLALVGYEGGQHMVGLGAGENDADLTALFHAANRHPRMHDLYLRYLNQWQSLGGGAMSLFNTTERVSKYGSWGLLEYQDQPLDQAPKYRAVTEFREALRSGGPRPVVANVTGLSPASGLGSGGGTVTITGYRLDTATGVAFGGTPAAFQRTVVGGAPALVATVPPRAAGQVDVTVTNGAGASAPSPASRFTYLPPLPAVTAVSPSTAVIGGGTTVTLTGTNFTGARSVTIAGGLTYGHQLQVLSDTSLRFVTPPWRAGTYNVEVTTASGTSTVVGRLTFANGPTMTGLAPSTVVITGGATVTVTGANLTGVKSVRIAGGSTWGSSVRVLSDTSLTFVAPPWRVGTYDLAVTTAAGTVVSVGSITYVNPPPPVVAALSPASGPAGASSTVVVTGSNLAMTWQVTVGGTKASFTKISDTQLSVVVPAHASGTGAVVVTTNGGTSNNTVGYTWVG